MRVFPRLRRRVSSVANVVLKVYPQLNSDQLTSSSHRLVHPLKANKSGVLVMGGLMSISYSRRAVPGC